MCLSVVLSFLVPLCAHWLILANISTFVPAILVFIFFLHQSSLPLVTIFINLSFLITCLKYLECWHVFALINLIFLHSHRKKKNIIWNHITIHTHLQLTFTWLKSLNYWSTKFGQLRHGSLSSYGCKYAHMLLEHPDNAEISQFFFFRTTSAGILILHLSYLHIQLATSYD